MYKNFTVFFIILVLFTGCSQKLNEYAKPTDILQEQALISTQKVIIKEKNSAEAYLTVTHINQIEQEKIKLDKNTEVFLIGVYIPTEHKQKDIFDISTVKINGTIENNIRVLKYDNPIVSIISFKNPWTIYFLVEAPKDYNKKGVDIEISVENLGSAKLNFYDSYGNLPMGTSMHFKTISTSD
jgi:hypothetical protein